MPELKPCPFCGKMPYTEHTKQEINGRTVCYTVSVRCLTDGVCIKGTSLTRMQSAEENAVKRWNRRVDE